MLSAGYHQPICKVRIWHTMAGSPTLSKQPLPAKALIDFLACTCGGRTGLPGKRNGAGIPHRP